MTQRSEKNDISWGFMVQTRDGCTRVYRRRNARFARNCVLEVDNFGGGSVMMRGAISYARKTQLMHIPGSLKVEDTMGFFLFQFKIKFFLDFTKASYRLYCQKRVAILKKNEIFLKIYVLDIPKYSFIILLISMLHIIKKKRYVSRQNKS
jgi:hypothetical protein